MALALERQGVGAGGLALEGGDGGGMRHRRHGQGGRGACRRRGHERGMTAAPPGILPSAPLVSRSARGLPGVLARGRAGGGGRYHTDMGGETHLHISRIS